MRGNASGGRGPEAPGPPQRGKGDGVPQRWKGAGKRKLLSRALPPEQRRCPSSSNSKGYDPGPFSSFLVQLPLVDLTARLVRPHAPLVGFQRDSVPLAAGGFFPLLSLLRPHGIFPFRCFANAATSVSIARSGNIVTDVRKFLVSIMGNKTCLVQTEFFNNALSVW